MHWIIILSCALLLAGCSPFKSPAQNATARAEAVIKAAGSPAAAAPVMVLDRRAREEWSSYISALRALARENKKEITISLGDAWVRVSPSGDIELRGVPKPPTPDFVRKFLRGANVTVAP